MVSELVLSKTARLMPALCEDVIRAMSEAISIVKAGKHDPLKAHHRIKDLYTWNDVAGRTERVYEAVFSTAPYDFWTRMHRYATVFFT